MQTSFAKGVSGAGSLIKQYGGVTLGMGIVSKMYGAWAKQIDELTIKHEKLTDAIVQGLTETGDLQSGAYANAIGVFAWSWGSTQTGSLHDGSGGGSGNVNMQDVSFTMNHNQALPHLFLANANGKHYPDATGAPISAGWNIALNKKV